MAINDITYALLYELLGYLDKWHGYCQYFVNIRLLFVFKAWFRRRVPFASNAVETKNNGMTYFMSIV